MRAKETSVKPGSVPNTAWTSWNYSQGAGLQGTVGGVSVKREPWEEEEILVN